MDLSFDNRIIISGDDRVRAIIIYDIVNDKQRNKLAKYLKSYGVFVQKSAVQVCLKRAKYKTLISCLPQFVSDDKDSIRVYNFSDYKEPCSFGKKVDTCLENVIVI